MASQNSNSNNLKRRRFSINDAQPPLKKARGNKLAETRDQASRLLGPFARSGTLKTSLGRKDAKMGSEDIYCVPGMPCILTNSYSQDVRPFHVIPQDAPSDLIEKLEGIWGLESNSFNVNDPSNFIPLTSELYNAFQAGQWALVPTNTMIAISMHRFAGSAIGLNDDNFKCVYDIYKKEGKTTFEYALLPLPGFQTVINRANNSATRRPTFSAYNPPYANFPRLALSLPPHVAIYDLVTKYRKLDDEAQEVVEEWMLEHNIELSCWVQEAEETYKLWMGIEDEVIDFSHAFEGGENEYEYEVESDEDESSQGEPGRLLENEYPDFPPLDDADDALVLPLDSSSYVSLESHLSDDHEPEEFCESRQRFGARIFRWLADVFLAGSPPPPCATGSTSSINTSPPPAASRSSTRTSSRRRPLSTSLNVQPLPSDTGPTSCSRSRRRPLASTPTNIPPSPTFAGPITRSRSKEQGTSPPFPTVRPPTLCKAVTKKTKWCRPCHRSVRMGHDCHRHGPC